MKRIYQKYIPKKITLYTVCIVLLIVAGSSFTKDETNNKDEAAYKTSQKAFLEVYKVLMSPRCMNCHPSGDIPLQGDDSHLHTMKVQRGTDGKGVYALKCANCHQPENTVGLNMPPGNPNWHLPAANMKLVFEGKTPKQLAMQLKDPKQNGGKTLEQLYHHVAEDALVLWGWAPGDGRSLPPLGHDEFVKQFRAWIDGGAAIPD
jgi:hypothetical protein